MAEICLFSKLHAPLEEEVKRGRRCCYRGEDGLRRRDRRRVEQERWWRKEGVHERAPPRARVPCAN